MFCPESPRSPLRRFVGIAWRPGSYPVRLAKWAHNRADKKPNDNQIFSFFYDKKDTHYIVSKLRRDLVIKNLYMTGELKVEGFTPPKPPDDLVALRKDTEKMAGGASP